MKSLVLKPGFIFYQNNTIVLKMRSLVWNKHIVYVLISHKYNAECYCLFVCCNSHGIIVYSDELECCLLLYRYISGVREWKDDRECSSPSDNLSSMQPHTEQTSR